VLREAEELGELEVPEEEPEVGPEGPKVRTLKDDGW